MSKYCYLIIGLLFLISCQSTKQHIADADISYTRAGSAFDDNSSNSDIAEMIHPYKEEMDGQMNIVLGELPEDLRKDRPNSNMGNWFCDALLYMAKKHNSSVDFMIQNYGGLRIPFLAKGKITKANIYELMPFDNKLVILELNADQLMNLLNNIAKDRGWPISKNVSFRIDNNMAVDVKIHNENIQENRIYLVALPDYVANGGGGNHFLKEIKQINTELYIRDILIEYLIEMKAKNISLTVDKSKRIF